MKNIKNLKAALWMIVLLATNLTVFAQDTVSSSSSSTTTTTTTWYAEPWAWGLGAVILIIIIVSLVRGGGSGTVDKVTVTKKVTREDV